MSFGQIVNTVLGAIGGVLAYIFGPWDALIIVLICVVVLDYTTGVISAVIQKNCCSTVGFRGILKKMLIFVMVALAALLDRLVPATNEAARAAVCIFYIANEGISILENAGEIGLPLPPVLKNSLMRLKHGGDGDGEGKGEGDDASRE